MKRLASAAAVLLLACAAVSATQAADNISGIWSEVSSGHPEVRNIQLMYAQTGNTVQAIGYFELNGVPCVWHGT